MSFLEYFMGLPYMRWNIIFVFVPSIIIWFFYWKYLLKYKKTILYVTVGSFVWGLLFDLVASPILNVWHFNSMQNLGISFLGLPLEEYLFILIVPQELTAIVLILRKDFYGTTNVSHS